MKSIFKFTLEDFDLMTLRNVINENHQIELSEDILKRVQKGNAFLQSKLDKKGTVIYGVNTGFGSLCNTIIEPAKLADLQYNLIRSHACGTGDLVPYTICKLILLSKIRNLSYGYSGVSPTLLTALVRLYNLDLIPVIYQLGSLGASGDLAPLAHMSLPLLGEGKVYYKEAICDMADIMDQVDFTPVSLGAKEGLSLLNGTQFSLSYAIWNVSHSERILRLSNLIASISSEAYNCMIDPYLSQLHKVRNQNGQQVVANEMYALLSASPIINGPNHDVQDPYSFRCIPQVHGASYDAIKYVRNIVENEINAVTDNPNIFPDDDLIVSGGNFHAQPLALPLDFLAIALSELGNISERRTFKLVNGDRDLPSYLTKNPGLESGFMIAQYTAASIVSQNKQLCSPSSIDSITSSKGQEDHVSMAANSATKCYRIVENLYRILSIELMVAAQGVSFRRPTPSNEKIQQFLDKYREIVPPLEKDRVLHTDIEKGVSFLMDAALTF